MNQSAYQSRNWVLQTRLRLQYNDVPITIGQSKRTIAMKRTIAAIFDWKYTFEIKIKTNSIFFFWFHTTFLADDTWTNGCFYLRPIYKQKWSFKSHSILNETLIIQTYTHWFKNDSAEQVITTFYRSVLRNSISSKNTALCYHVKIGDAVITKWLYQF